MKNLLKIFVIIFVSSLFNKANAQIDTLNYVKQFEINKANYIGKPFSFLLGKMTLIQPKTNWSHSSSWKRNVRNETDFRFTYMEASFYNVINLTIVWQDAIPTNDIKYYEKKNGYYFTNDEKAFYSNRIIKDIRVYR